MAIPIGAKPDSGFDDPIGMLKDCHRRIEHFLNILCLVADRAHIRKPYGRGTACRTGRAAVFSRGWRTAYTG